jgi:hypothetical protein
MRKTSRMKTLNLKRIIKMNKYKNKIKCQFWILNTLYNKEYHWKIKNIGKTNFYLVKNTLILFQKFVIIGIQQI